MNNKQSYNPIEWEEQIYKLWEDANAFHAEDNSKKPPFSIIMPPPNVTSQAHIGHAMDMTFQDVLIRYKRMQGFNCLWQPGTDHAALATEHKLVEKLAKEGKTKEQIGRSEFDKLAWEWYDYYGDRILKQFHRLGFSADWQRYHFTMDEQSTKAVLTAFINLYNKGLIYRGKRQTNWCVHCKSVISDDEVEYADEAGHMWHIRYPYADGSGHIVVATTRPETLFGDTAVAVNPKDKRYTKIVGKMLNLPLTDRQIPIIADDYVEKEFGTGMVKITPAHDPNDYEVGKRHNLEVLTVINKEGKLTEIAGKFAGLDLLEGRKQAVEELDKLGLLEKVEPYKHNVGHCARCHTAIEPMITEQWFVAMKELVKPAINAVKTGELQIHPKRFENNYFRWLENIQDWCISRQIWTGHRIPIYYCDKCGHAVAERQTPKECPKCHSTSFTQDPDVLDTWFSSSLWPFSTLGWPEQTQTLKQFYPTDCLVTAYDILTQWLTKMVYMGYECVGKTPFKHALIHGLVRDEKGRKMSKSLGNGVDPLEICEKYGADCLRLALIKDMSMGMDTRYSDTKIDTSRGFINKLWNASKFVSMHSEGLELLPIEKVKLQAKDEWLLTKLSNIAKNAQTNIDNFELGVALSNICSFVLDDFCDYYVEFSKPSIFAGGDAKRNTVSVLNYALVEILKLLHPFIPYVTEYIYQNSKQINANGQLLMLLPYAQPHSISKLVAGFKSTENVIDAIKALRALKVENNIALNVKPKIVAPQDAKPFEDIINKLATVELVFDEQDGKVIMTNLGKFTLVAEKVDRAELEKQLREQISKLEFEIKRSSGMLSNPNFVAKAPEKLVAAEKQKLEDNKNKKAELEQKLSAL
ncbi:MAG: valine--tRNA ligase [Clostridia bacterium]|nr:valine--tRNA ligase [Clostridia bacterium]